MGRKSNATKLEEKLEEVNAVIEEYEKSQQGENLEFPLIDLPGRKYFKLFDEGENVKNLQTAMNRLMCTNVPVTGIYDSETIDAVTKFEEKYGTDPNGRFGLSDLRKYNKLRGAK
jgi:peptidoglycan hydrolase-like protein with peptidoglycan-binding domain